jgi:hypothetical protein
VSLADQWALLGIAPTDDRREIKRAYTRVLKSIDVDSDPAAFIALRQAMEDALAWGTSTPWWEDDECSFDPASADEAVDGGEADNGEEDEFDSDQYLEHVRPPLPAERHTAVDAACAELDRLLFGEVDADPQRVGELGRMLLAAPELENVDRLNDIEQWLIQAIAGAAPRSDPLIAPSVARFGWDKAGRHWRREFDLEAILQRREDLKFLARCRDERNLHHRALEELSGPPRDRIGLRDLAIARDVSAFLEIVDREHPSLHNDMNPETVDWWRSYFHRRHMPGEFWGLLGLGTFGISASAAIPVMNGQLNPWWGLSLGLAAAPITFGIILLVAELGARLRERAARRWDDAAQGRSWSVWLVIASLLLPVILALAPNIALITWSGTAAAALLLVSLLWSIWSHPADFWLLPKLVFLPFLAALISTQMAVILEAPDTARLLPPLFALAWIGYLGSDAIQQSLLNMGAGGRRAWILVSLLLTLASGVLLADDSIPWPPADLTLVLVPVALIAVHLATSASPVDTHVAEWPLRLVAVLFYFSSGTFQVQFGQGLLLTFCVYGLAYAALRAGFALKHELTVRVGTGAME